MLRRRRAGKSGKLESTVNHERWLVSYADFITLLFAFFVVMYSVSQVNESKYRTLSETLEAAFSGSVENSSNAESTVPENGSVVTNLARLGKIAEALEAILPESIPSDSVQLSGNEQWLEIALDANLLFRSGQDELGSQARALLSSVAEVLSPYDNAIAIEGHTDDMPIRNSRFRDNWDLSSARAVAVVSYLSFQGVAPERLSAVGYGEYRPIATNASDQGRALNRRVVLKIARDATPSSTELVEPEFDDDSTEESSIPASTPSADSSALSSGEPASSQAQPVSGALPEGIETVRLKRGGLLFSSDPDLPRVNPPVESPPP